MLPQHYKYQKQMIYELALHLPYWNYDSADYEANETHKKNLESISDLEKKLNYYNENINSLSTYAMEARIHFRWGNPNQLTRVFCNCSKCRALPSFETWQEELYFKLREEEVIRIQSKIEALSTYREKLQFIFSVKGYHPDQPPRIWPNIPYNPLDNADRDMVDSEPIIDMEPKSKEEVEIYNQFVQIAFNNRFKHGNDFTYLYNGFAAGLEKKRLNAILLRADDFMILLEYIKKEIEKAFNYPTSLQKEKEQHDRIAEFYNQSTRLQLAKPSLLFAQMCLGIEYNSDKHVLDEYALLHYTHTKEVYEYYKYVKRLLEKGIESIKAESSDTNEDEEQKSNTKENIASILETLSNGLGWQYAFYHRKDYETFLNLLIAFFDGKKYKISENPILLRKGTKTEVAKKLNVIYQQSGIKKTLRTNTDYFCLIKHLDSFKDVTDDQLYSALMK